MTGEQDRGRERRQRILDAGISVFSRKGYRDTVVDEIAAESGTSKGGVYFHFPNKQAIFMALLDGLAKMLRERIENAVRGESQPVVRAEAALREVLDTFGSHRRLARLFMVEALGARPEFNQRLVEIRAEFAELIERYLDDAVASGAIPPLDTAIAASAWFGAVNEIVTQWALANRSRTSLLQAYPTIRTLFLRGIGVPDESNAR